MISGYPVGASSTMDFGDLYNGGGSYAPAVEKATNPPPTNTAKNTPGEANKSNSVTGGVPSVGLEVPTLITLGILALVLVRYY